MRARIFLNQEKVFSLKMAERVVFSLKEPVFEG